MAPSDLTLWARQNPGQTVDDVRTTFSSWDRCMQKNYCKYPAIVGIVIGALVILGIAWCIIGCMCCGYTCCKGCCSCCCPSSKGGRDRTKYADPPPPPRQNPNYGYQPNPAPPVYAPQNSYAQFDTPSRPAPKVNEDALPAMPSWSDAKTRRVEDHSQQDMEMNRLDPSTGGAVGAVGRSGRGGYREVPNSPGFAPDTYRGTETNTTHHNPMAIGVARSGSPYDSHNGQYGRYDDDHLHHRHHTPSPRYSPPHASGGLYSDAPARAHTRSPGSPGHAPSYSPYPHTGGGGGGGGGYTPYSPTLPSTPPPPFSSVQDNDARTPSLLQPGRKPVNNSWRDV